jgi:hypothetical protein
MLKDILTKAAALPLLAKVCAGLALALALSAWLSLCLYGKLAAADAECRADTAEAVLKAIEAHKDAQEQAQDEIDADAAAESATAQETLADIATSTDTALATLRRQYADALTRRPVFDCTRQPAVRLRTVNSALSRSRSD